ncbi:MAG: GAF domain-containing protein [Pseudomonadota bacterium]
MFASSAASLTPDYPLLARQLASLLEGERDLTANAAQFSAFINDNVADLNWAGFYFLRKARKHEGLELLLGPFQGKVACYRIPIGRGVCGTAIAERKTMLVPDVHAFSGHIACDSASNAEIVIPLFKDGEPFGVLDIDSPTLDRFRESDQVGLELLLATFISATDLV